jgi:putative RNA 2'-phosphotransferase
LLYHGTATAYLKSIDKQGLIKGSRHHVHLSADPNVAKTVGARHGFPTVLTVLSGQMLADGYVFYISDNGVWLTDHVPPNYLRRS